MIFGIVLACFVVSFSSEANFFLRHFEYACLELENFEADSSLQLIYFLKF